MLLAASTARATTAVHPFNAEGAGDAMMKIAAGLAVKKAMKEKNHGLDRLPVASIAPQLALQHVLGYVYELFMMAAATAIPGRGVADGGGAKFPSSEARTSDTAKSDFPAESEVHDWRSRTCPSRGLQNKRERENRKKIGFRPRFPRPAPIGGAG